jgi:hypothetical protein
MGIGTLYKTSQPEPASARNARRDIWRKIRTMSTYSKNEKAIESAPEAGSRIPVGVGRTVCAHAIESATATAISKGQLRAGPARCALPVL